MALDLRRRLGELTDACTGVSGMGGTIKGVAATRADAEGCVVAVDLALEECDWDWGLDVWVGEGGDGTGVDGAGEWMDGWMRDGDVGVECVKGIDAGTGVDVARYASGVGYPDGGKRGDNGACGDDSGVW